MRRTLIFLLKLAALVAIAVWLAERPGAVSVQWFGYRIDTSVGLLLAAALLLAVVVAVAWQLWRFFTRSPRQIARARHESRRRKGYKALTQGMAAVAAGDVEEARRQTSRAAVLLNEPPLTLLLAAQTAQLSGDEQAARKYFTAMLERPETSFLGLRGLLTQALKAGDRQAALDYAGRAHRERPGAAWATTTLLELQLKQGDWNGAEATIKEALKQKSVTQEHARRTRAVILAERARLGVAALAKSGAADGGSIETLNAAREAVKLAPELVPARAMAALLTGRGGNEKAAAKLIEQGWPAAPHPMLAAAYAALRPSEEPVARARRFEKLAALHPEHRESRLALAEAALAAGLWGEARTHLARLAEAEREAPSARLCRLMARLEEGERGDAAAARRWLMQASEASGDPAWTCEQCGTPAAEWQARCTRCGAFDSLAWRAAPRPAALTLATMPPAAAAMPVAAHAAAAPAAIELGARSEAASRTDEAEAEAGAGVDAARLVN